MGSNSKKWISHGPNSNVFLRKILRKKKTLFIQMVSNSVPIWNFWFVVQQDNNKSNCQVVVATINLLHQALGATEWSPSTIRSNRCGTNGMGLKTAKTSLWLVGLPQWRGSRSRNGESTSRLPKKILFTVPDCKPVNKHSL